jgi:hypothetical protein
MEEVQKLQRTVRNVLLGSLGLQHAATRRITLALSGSVFALGQIDEAADLWDEVHEACKTYFGETHHDTLTAKCMLGEFRHSQGRHTEMRLLRD